MGNGRVRITLQSGQWAENICDRFDEVNGKVREEARKPIAGKDPVTHKYCRLLIFYVKLGILKNSLVTI